MDDDTQLAIFLLFLILALALLWMRSAALASEVGGGAIRSAG